MMSFDGVDICFDAAFFFLALRHIRVARLLMFILMTASRYRRRLPPDVAAGLGWGARGGVLGGRSPMISRQAARRRYYDRAFGAQLIYEVAFSLWLAIFHLAAGGQR